VTATADRDRQPASDSELHRGRYVAGDPALGDEGGMAVDSTVPHPARLMVAVVARAQQQPGESGEASIMNRHV
jgi:hypothetical protein